MIDIPKAHTKALLALAEVRAKLPAMLEKIDDARTYKPADLGSPKVEADG